MKFNPTLSFDGVAALVALAGVCIWAGSIEARMKATEETTKANTVAIQETVRTLAVVTTRLDDQSKKQ